MGRVYLPSSFMGSPRKQRKLVQDAMAIVAKYGRPTYFITMTCNPNWDEITQHPGMDGQNASDRPDIACRVFKQKFKKVLERLNRGLLGKKIYLLYVIEFQKRGLPHAHIALKTDMEPSTGAEIDSVICARIPEDETLLPLVERFMMHTHGNLCARDANTCKKRFPKPLALETHIDERGFPVYQRLSQRDRYVVPYNIILLKMANSHVNVELACNVNLIMYLYKYMFKGPDRTKYIVQGETTDEIEEYIGARYLSASEACWRIFCFHINQRTPAVTALPIHLENENCIVYREGTNIQEVIDRAISPLELYFSRPRDLVDCTYVNFYENYIVKRGEVRPNSAVNYWTINTRGVNFTVYRRTRGEVVARMYMMYPNRGEIYYLRLILLSCKPISFADAKTVGSDVCVSYQAAAMLQGLLDVENEWLQCFQEAVNEAFYSPHQLRSLFVTLAMDGAGAVQIFQHFSLNLRQDLIENGM